jgi:hypothetical protein
MRLLAKCPHCVCLISLFDDAMCIHNMSHNRLR